MMNYLLSAIADICGAELWGKDSAVRSVTTDSRSPWSDGSTLFVALRTEQRDGHDFVAQMYSRGVRAFLVERYPDLTLYPEAGFVVAGDTLSALQALAAFHRSAFKGTLAAVTGSSGKTVVKEWIAQTAPDGVKLFRSPGSYNSQIGVPLSVLMIEGDEQVAVIEAGISHKGEMEALARILRPDIGIFTTIGAAHQENFDSLQDKIREKARLFEGCGRIIYDGDYPQVGEVLARECAGAALTDSSFLKEVYDAMPDRASAQNAAQAVCFWDMIMPSAHGQVMDRISSLRPVAMRMELKEGINDSVVVNDTYDSDLGSLATALDFLSRVGAGRGKVLVLSDILENGTSDERLYASAARMAAEAGIERLIAVGKGIGAWTGKFACEVERYDTAEECVRHIVSGRIASRAILVKGCECAPVCHALEKRSHTTVLEVDLDAMIHNLKLYRSRLKPETRITAMVKAASYGHGTFEIASTLCQQGVDYLAVAFADEGVTLRREGITAPVLVLNADEGSFEVMVRYDLEPEIYNFASLADFVDVVRRYGCSAYPVHIKIDSGMHRLGFMERDLPQLCRYLNENAGYVRVSTIFSHFAVADTPQEDAYTLSQIEYFRRMCDALTDALGYRPLRHIAATSGMERFPQAQEDMCRLGIGLYGVGLPGVRKIASLKTRIVRIAQLEAGDTVGYGRAGKITRPSRIATVPIGYADGLDRHLGQGAWSMLVRDGMAPIVGRICMDSCMIDVTDIEGAAEGDTVTIFSERSGNTVEDMARVLDTIPYEIMTSVSSRVKRVYLKE